MTKNSLKHLLLILLVSSVAYSQKIVDCRVLTEGRKICNLYGSKLITIKKTIDKDDNAKLVIERKRKKHLNYKLGVVSVEDIWDKYIADEKLTHLRIDKYKPIIYTKVQKDKNLTKEPKKSIVYGKYIVLNGDVLSKIASKFELKTRELRKFNNLKGDARLRVGQELRLPFAQSIVDVIVSGKYIIQKGDSISSIAKKFGFKTKQLIKYNRMKSKNIIIVGKSIKLPLPYILAKEAVANKIALNKKKKLAKKKALAQKKKHKVNMTKGIGKRKLRVTATAYSSHSNQTDSTPFLAAWNNRIRPGMRIIAVSRDMLTKYRMKNGTRIRIGGLPGYYTVRDKMNKRYKKRIDIYMGMNRRKALRWGKRSVVIYW